MNVKLEDFNFRNCWSLDSDGPKTQCCPDHESKPKYIIDRAAERKYRNESEDHVRFTCFALALATPTIHEYVSVVNVAYRIVKLVTLSHFWFPKHGERSYNFEHRLNDAGIDLLRIVAAPIATLGLELAALYGIFSPYNGMKLYATIERAQYGHWILAPFFQPIEERGRENNEVMH